MKRYTLTVAALALFLSVLAQHAAAADAPKAPPKDRVVAIYFHRTQRCPTCLKMGSYSEEAIGSGFATQLKGGTVEFHYIDFQNKNNAAFTRAYQITGPALIVAKVVDNKVAEFKNLKDIWTHVGDKKAFIKYVQDNVAACQTAAK
ncbi:MAG: nitrophenyl compound nitroreductase subunit ArsF family protein [Thermoguttaceae bacterium]